MMEALRDLASARFAAFRSGWSVDLADPLRMAGARSRILVWAATFASVVMLVSWCVQPAEYTRVGPGANAVIASGLIAIGGFARWRRERMTDREFLVLMVLDLIFSAVTTAMAGATPEGLGPEVGMGVLPAVILGAIFAGRWWHVLVQGVVACSLLIVVPATFAPETSWRQNVGGSLVSLPLVAVVVRWLLEQSVRALTAARRGEVTDPLTGLGNRRGLERAGGRQWQEHARSGLPLAVLVIDVDHFKDINDTRGHAAGDDLLRRLAEVVSRQLRAGDVAVRLGGEEFLVLCEVAPSHANLVAERLRRAIERDLAPVTVSIGVHVASPAEGDEAEALWSAVAVADRALYSAKHAGRNRVVNLDH